MSSSLSKALQANAIVALAKAGGAFLTGSASLAAEAVHSAADTGNQLLLLWGRKASKRRPDTAHPLGYGRESFFWALIVGLVMFGLGGVYSALEGWHKLSHPEPLQHTGVAIAILIIGAIFEGRALASCLQELRDMHPNKSFRYIVKETRNAELLVLLLEDSAALLGLLMAVCSIGMATITGNPVWDAVGSLAIGILLMGVATVLIIETKGLLIGQSASPETRKAIHTILYESSHVDHVYECIASQNGVSVDLFLRVRLTCPQETPLSEVLNIVEAIEQELYALPQVRKCFLEIDNKADDTNPNYSA